MISRRHVLLFAILCLILVAVNGYFFPLAVMNDSHKYLSLSQDISRVFSGDGSILGIEEKYRILGYPGVIAALAHVFGSPAFLAVYISQATLVVATGLILIWTLTRLGIPLFLSAPLSLLYVAALPTMLASFLLTDAINNALTAIAVCLLAVPLFRASKSCLAYVALAGISMGLAFFIRDANQYLVICLLPMVLAIAWQRKKFGTGLVLIVAFVAPVLIASAAYKSFNETRFGQRFVTSGGRTVMLHAVLPLAKRNPEIFDGTSDLDRTARSILKSYNFTETRTINRALLAQGHDEVELSKEAFAKYFEAWRRFPLAMASTVLGRMRFDKQATELMNPMAGFYNNSRWRGETTMAESKRLRSGIENGNVSDIFIALSVLLGRIPSVLVYAIVLIGSPVVAFIAWTRSDRETALGLASLFVTYASYTAVYGLVNVEMRYLAGIAVVLPISAAVTIYTVSGWIRWTSPRFYRRPERIDARA
jgi:hypothetical protein